MKSLVKMNVALWTFFLLLANPLQAKRLSKADRQSVEKLGLEYLKADNHENAVKLFNLVVEHQPHNTNTRCNLAVALMRMGNGPKTRVEWERLYTQAIRQYRVALAIDPTLNLAVEGMALTKSNVRLRMDLVGGALEEAERLIARALGEADPYAADIGESGAMAADRGGEKYLPHRGDDGGSATAEGFDAALLDGDDKEFGGDEGDDDTFGGEDDDLFGTVNVVQVGGSPMQELLDDLGLGRWHDALVEYGACLPAHGVLRVLRSGVDVAAGRVREASHGDLAEREREREREREKERERERGCCGAVLRRPRIFTHSPTSSSPTSLPPPAAPGIDEMSFLREIEKFDMQYIGMPDADQTKLLRALKAL
jgi:tetratricopeptide (TPR) repeat protein